VVKRKREKNIREENKIELELYTLTEAAEIIRVHPATLRNWIKQGRLKVIDVAPKESKRKAYRVKRDELDRLIKAG
jgi:excisionase family DNA binding protein